MKDGTSRKKILQFGLPFAAKAGLSVTKLWEGIPDKEHDIFTPHSDKQYILVLLQHGHFKMKLDFEEIAVTSPAAVLISPGQVHHLIDATAPAGFSLDFEASLIPADLQYVLNGQQKYDGALQMDNTIIQEVFAIGEMMYRLRREDGEEYTVRALYALLHSLLYLIAGGTIPAEQQGAKKGRGLLIQQEFQQLLLRQYKTWKKPADYAAAMSITVSHLNDSVQHFTGIPVSAHIQQHIVQEAKRLLFATTMSVKEISYDLGYENPVYFSQLFKKLIGLTPLQFRAKFRDL